jgi:hypothetical protein
MADMASTVRWTGQCASRAMNVLAAGIWLVLTAVGVMLLTLAPAAPAAGWLVMVVAVAAGLGAWSVRRLEVRIDDAALLVRFGRWGWPRRKILWADVTAVSALRVEPMRWGGWGYRWLPWAHASAAVVRRGPGIRLSLTRGRTFVVTVDDAVEGAKAAERARVAAARR